jgi:hypothetical protein
MALAGGGGLLGGLLLADALDGGFDDDDGEPPMYLYGNGLIIVCQGGEEIGDPAAN